MSTPTTIERLEGMPDCPFATKECFCSIHFAAKSTLGNAARMLASAKTTSDKIEVTTRTEECPKRAIMTIGSGARTTAYRVSTIW